MNLSKLFILIKSEYLTDFRSKSYWISTFCMPLIAGLFAAIIGYLSGNSDTLQTTNNPIMPEIISGWQALGMIVGVFLTLFIMIYGAQIYNKVKLEKCNRLMEVLATCVDGRTMLFAKVISVGLLGITQMLIWLLLIASGVILFVMFNFGESIQLDILSEPRLYISMVLSILFFIGGYIFYGAMYAATGAMTDKNQENQWYMTCLTFILLGSFYIGQFCVDNAYSDLALWCSYIPFTSATVTPIRAIGNDTPLWQTLLSLVILYASAFGALSFGGKLYTSTLLLKGRKLTPRDIFIFLKSK